MPNKTTSKTVATPETSRFCHIQSASIVDRNDAGDGAYDLLGVGGSPEEVGAAITRALKETDLAAGSRSLLDSGEVIRLNIHIDIQKSNSSRWYLVIEQDPFTDFSTCSSEPLVEGGWRTKEEADEFVRSEVSDNAKWELVCVQKGSVGEMMVQEFGVKRMEDTALRNLQLNTEVGKDCRKVIRSARALATLCADTRDKIVTTLIEQMQVFLHG